MKLSTSKRIQAIANQLQEEGIVQAKELAKKYSVSMETIRKDLTYLEQRGIAKKEYGGASLSQLGVETNVEYRSHSQEKTEIAKTALPIIKEAHSLLLDAGSTCLSLVPYINTLPSLDIFTSSLQAAVLLDGNIHNVFLLPGKKRDKNQSLVGNWTEQVLDTIHVDLCFLGTSGLYHSSGPTSHSYSEITLKQKMISQSDLIYVLADSSKFHETGLHTYASWDDIDGIITDTKISANTLNNMKDILILTD